MRAVAVGDFLLEAGHTPYIPHLTHFWHLVFPHEIEVWYKYDMEWLKLCQALLRLPGESEGADEEVKSAAILGLPVYYELTEIPPP